MQPILHHTFKIDAHLDTNKSKNKVTDSDTENFILISMCMWHMGSRWYTSDLHVVTTDSDAFVTTWYLDLHFGVEEFRSKCL